MQNQNLKNTNHTNSNLKAKPPTKFTPFRHNVIFLELPVLVGGLTLVPSNEKQLSNHPDSSDELGSVFLARRKS